MTRRARPRPAAPSALLLGLAVLLAGCGGSSDDPEPAPDPKPAYVEAASTVCSEADEEFTALAQPATPAEYGPFVAETIRIAEGAQQELSALTPPPDDRAELEEKVLTPLGELVEQGRAWSAQVTAAGTDQAALLGLLGTRPTSDGIDQEFLREYGLATCADVVAKLG